MLSTLRKGANTLFFKLLLGLLVVSFGLWGIQDIVVGGNAPYIAKVGKEVITLNAYEEEIRNLRQSFGENYSPELLKRFNLYQIKLLEMINQKLLELEAERLGIAIGDDALARTIGQNPAFKNTAGEFDKGLFYQALQELGMNEKQFYEGLRKDLASQLLVKTFSFYPPVPKSLLDTMYASQYEQRKILLAMADNAPGIALDAPDEQELQTFYNDHAERYTAPEYRSLRFIFIAPDSIFSKITVSRQEEMDAYQRRRDEFVQPEQRELEQLLYENKADAEKAYAMLEGGSGFETVAKAIPPTNANATTLGFKFKDELPTGSEQVFALAVGEHSTPLSSPFGWHLFYVKAIKEQQVASFDTVRAALEQEIRQSKADTLLTETLEQIEDKLAAGVTLETAAKELGLSFAQTEPLAKNGRKADRSQLLDPARYGNLLDTAFSLTQGERSSVTATPDGAYYVVEVTAITPARERAFEEVRGQVSEDWKEARQRDAYRTRLSELAKQLQGKSEAEQAQTLAQQGLTHQRLTLTRGGFVKTEVKQKLPEALAAALQSEMFPLQKGEATRIYSVGKGFAFALLLDVVPAQDASTPEGARDLAALGRSLREDYTQEILSQYLASLRERYPVDINEAAFTSVVEAQ